uniref:Prostaglandin E synthase n=1 Tax=Anser cygnoides TaxID=8845 RepID=A0A8B9EV42_ANSCY
HIWGRAALAPRQLPAFRSCVWGLWLCLFITPALELSSTAAKVSQAQRRAGWAGTQQGNLVGRNNLISLSRAHRNDMENIFPFLFLGAIYSLLEPSPAVARLHFFVFCAGRMVHTVAYLLRLKAPTRSVAYGVAQLPCFSMALQILLAAAPYW